MPKVFCSITFFATTSHSAIFRLVSILLSLGFLTIPLIHHSLVSIPLLSTWILPPLTSPWFHHRFLPTLLSSMSWFLMIDVLGASSTRGENTPLSRMKVESSEVSPMSCTQLTAPYSPGVMFVWQIIKYIYHLCCRTRRRLLWKRSDQVCCALCWMQTTALGTGQWSRPPCLHNRFVKIVTVDLSRKKFMSSWNRLID